MGKGSTITFVSIIASIIIFSAFLSIFPHGIKIARMDEIKYEGNELNFYGGMEGNGTGRIYAYNSFLTIEGESINGSMMMEGSFHFVSPSSLFMKGAIVSNAIQFHAFECILYYKNGEKMYKNVDGVLEGNISLNISGEFIMKEGCENKSFLSSIIPNDFSRVFPLKFNKLFFIEGGKIWVNGEERNFSDYVFFRGEGKFISPSTFKGGGYLLAIDGEFYEKGDRIFIFPIKVIILWIAAISIFIISLFFKKNIMVEKDKIFMGFSIVVPILFFAISFYLWNGELERIFGLNLFALREINIGNALFISLAIVPYLVAVGIIGFPTKVAISSVFEIFGMVNLGKGIGRCCGFLLTTIWGISMINSILNMALSPLLRLL